jgi:ubiquitin fusion degradation protein 1
MYGNRGRRNIQIDTIFIEVYRAFPASIMGRDDIDLSNSIILPQSALGKLSVMRNFGDTKNPILFRILNIELNIYTHCGVVEFTAEEGTCYIPSNMFERLCLMEGQQINVRNVTLQPGTFIKLQPHKTEFINNPNPKTILEYNLRNYFCVTEGDTISVKFGKNIYKIDIVQCKPNKAIRTLNCDIEVDFDPPKDYKEPVKQNINNNNNNSSTIKFNSDEKPFKKLTEEEIKKQIEDKKFSGHHFRIDGKNVTNTQVQKIMKAKLESKNNEDNYNPRECRIISNPRPSFRYVEL